MRSFAKILVPLDFSRTSAYAFQTAAALARGEGAGLVPLRVEPPGADDPGAREARRADPDRRSDLAPATAGDAPVARRSVRGDPADAVVGLAREMGCDLIVMAVDDRAGDLGPGAAGVAEQVLRRSAVPVLVVRTPPAASRPGGPAGRDRAVRTILAPVDLCRPSRRGVHVAAALARAHGANLVLLHVQGRDGATWSETPAGFDAEASFRMQALRRMALLRDELDVVDCERRMARGRPVEEIVKQAVATACDLIVMDAHGNGGGIRALLGSVAGGAAREAGCPVLILKEPSDLAAAGPRIGQASGRGEGASAARSRLGSGPDAGRDRDIVAHRSTRADDAGVRLHHRDHPKIVGEGATLREAADRLIDLFDRERRRSVGGRGRSAISGAESDARRYRTALGRGRRPGSNPAAPHAPRRHLP